MKFASICITHANKRQFIAATQLNGLPSYHVESLKARAIPIITGTAAPLRVFGRAANIHAFMESFIISFDFIFLFSYYLLSLNILTMLSNASDISDNRGWLFITIIDIYSIMSSPFTSADLMVYFFCCS